RTGKCCQFSQDLLVKASQMNLGWKNLDERLVGKIKSRQILLPATLLLPSILTGNRRSFTLDFTPTKLKAPTYYITYLL
ncbi:MAG TPA: hypothetical protein VGO47_01195, partial [Chlamydiales bacterium]|nr:hypothetical protein [Chlamydiales bacterium]